MDYSAKYSGGFSLIELLVVIAIIALVGGLGTTIFLSYSSTNSMEITINSLVESIRHAQSNAQQVQNDSKWGVKILPTQIVVFSGDSYGLRNQSSDQLLILPSGISVSGETEFIFEKVTGLVESTGTTTISSVGASRDIHVNEKGTITY